MLLQVVLNGLQLAGVCRAKSSLHVDVHEPRLLEMDNHIWLMVALHIDETQGDGDQVIAATIELGADVDTCFRGVPARKLDYFDTPFEVHSNKVAGISRRVVLPHHRIDLEGAGSSVVNMVL